MPLLILSEAYDPNWLVRNGEEFWMTGCPSPHTVLQTNPDRSLAVFVQGFHDGGQGLTMYELAPNIAEFATRSCIGGDPHCAVPRLKQRSYDLAGQLGNLSEFVVLPAGESFIRANPERAILPSQEDPDDVSG